MVCGSSNFSANPFVLHKVNYPVKKNNKLIVQIYGVNRLYLWENK